MVCWTQLNLDEKTENELPRGLPRGSSFCQSNVREIMQEGVYWKLFIARRGQIQMLKKIL